MIKPIITSNKEILGGTPCFAGTRIPLTVLMHTLDRDGVAGAIKGWPYLKAHRPFMLDLLKTIEEIKGLR